MAIYGCRPGLLDDSQVAAHLRKGGQPPIEVGLRVRRGVHHADAGQPARHGGEAERHRKDACVEQAAAELLRQPRIAQHHRHNGRLGAACVEPQPLHSGLEVACVLPQPRHQLLRFLQQVHGREASGGVGRGDCAGEEEGPRLLADVVHDGFLARDDAADHAERLAERADLQVEHAVQAEMVHDAAAAAAQHALAVRIIHHRQHAVLLRDLAEPVERRDVAVHAEHAIGDEQAAAVVGQVLANLGLGIGHVAVLVDDDLRAAQPRAVDDAGVVEPVGEDDVLLADERADGRLVGDEAALQVERILHVLELGQPVFQLDVERLGARDAAHRGRADAPLLDGLDSRVLEPRVIGEAEIVVRAEVEHAVAVHHHPGVRGRAHRAQGDEEVALAQGCHVRADEVEFVVGHHITSLTTMISIGLVAYERAPVR